MQNELSVSARSGKAEVAFCAGQDDAFLAYQPFGGVHAPVDLGPRQPFLQQLADVHGVSPQRIALAWVLTKAPNVIPIPGASRPATIVDSAQAGTVRLAPKR